MGSREAAAYSSRDASVWRRKCGSVTGLSSRGMVNNYLKCTLQIATTPINVTRGALYEACTLGECGLRFRNKVLPKLMSGEIRVKDAEREVEEVI